MSYFEYEILDISMSFSCDHFDSLVTFINDQIAADNQPSMQIFKLFSITWTKNLKKNAKNFFLEIWPENDDLIMKQIVSQCLILKTPKCDDLAATSLKTKCT